MGISIWKLLLTLFIIILVFGTKKLRNVGSDLAGALTNFRRSVREEETPTTLLQSKEIEQEKLTEGQMTNKQIT